MKREIEFRGKRKDNGEWVYGDLVHVGDGCIIITSSNLIVDDSLAKEYDLAYSENEFAVVLPETVGQYTGLKDKNGNKIFEGDIIRIHEGRNDFKITSILWSDDFLYYEPSNEELRHALKSRYSEHYEIIGNIHDNPHLINPIQ